MSTESETGKHKRGIFFIILLMMVECIPPGGLMTAQDNNPGKVRNLDHDWGVHNDECGFYPFGSRIRESYLKYELLIVANGYAGRGEPVYAEAFYELLTMLIPGYLNGWFSYAGFLETRDETGRAEECYMKILELDPGNPAAQERIKILRDKKEL